MLSLSLVLPPPSLCSHAPLYEYYRPHDFTPSIEAADLMCKLLRKNAEDRISAADALCHPWFADAQDDEAFNKLVLECSRLYGEAMEQTLVDARAAGDALEGMAVGEAIDLAGIATIHVPPKTPNGTVVEGEAAESSALRGAGTQGGRGFPAMDARGSESGAGSGSGGGAGEDGMDVSCDET